MLASHAINAGTTSPLCSAAVYSIHLLVKPLINGIPIMLPMLISQPAVVRGIRCANPPN